MNEDRNYMGSVSRKLYLMLFRAGAAAASDSISVACARKYDNIEMRYADKSNV